MTDETRMSILGRLDQIRQGKVDPDPLEQQELLESVLRDILPSRRLSLYSQEFDDGPPVPSSLDAVLLPRGDDRGPIGLVFDRSDGKTSEASVNYLIKATAEAGCDEGLLITRGILTGEAFRAALKYDSETVILADMDLVQKWIDDPAVLPLGLGNRARVQRRVTTLSRGLALDIAKDPRSLMEIEWRQL